MPRKITPHISGDTINKMRKNWNIKIIKKEDENNYLKDQFMFPIETREKIEDNIKEYQSGNKLGAEYLISIFEPFLRTIVDFLCNKNMVIYSFESGINIVDKTTYKIVGSFIKKTEPGQKINEFQRVCNDIISSIYGYDPEEIYNELVCSLLTMARRYKVRKPGDTFYKEGGSFHTYLDRCFHFEVYHKLIKMIKANAKIEPLHHHKNDLDLFSEVNFIRVLEETEIYYRLLNSNKIIFKKQNSNPYNMESLNLNWINGITNTERFNSLSPYERKLLLKSYKDKLTDKEISSEIGYKRNTITVHRQKAIKKLT